jgi:putative ABC transport system permease protein
MKTPLAWYNLVHNKVKTSVAIAGVVFAIVLMFMQLGFLEAVKASATLIYDVLDFDICIRSKDYLHLAQSRSFPRTRLAQAAGVEGVERAMPFTVANNNWRNKKTGENRAILCFGIFTQDPVFRDTSLQQQARDRLNRHDELLIDTRSRQEFGPKNGKQFGPQDEGTQADINDHPVRIVGIYTLGAGLSAGGTAIMTDSGVRRTNPVIVPGQISLGLIKIQANQNPSQVVQRLRQVLYDDVDVQTRQEVIENELTYWVYETNYGLIFQTGVVLALIVGTAIVYQVLSSDVASMLPEYATLKAIGYSNPYLAGVVLHQAMILAVLGYAIGYLISQQLYLITAAGAQIPMRMTWQNGVLVFVLSLIMCVGSGLGALRAAFRADPAELF